VDTIRSGTNSTSGADGGKIGRTRLPRGCWLCALIVALALLLAACDSQSGGASATPPAAPTSTSALSGGPGPTVAASPSAQATTTGATGQVGFASVCSQPASVTAQLPANIPAYPGARLQISQAQGGFGLYGLCSGDGRAAIAAFYAAQLPAKGWQQLKQNPLSDTAIQITAAQGNAHVILTVADDAQAAGVVDIIIQTTGL
jgi:hypothetical protein